MRVSHSRESRCFVVRDLGWPGELLKWQCLINGVVAWKGLKSATLGDIPERLPIRCRTSTTLRAVRASASRGACCFGPESWAPTPRDLFQFVIEYLGSCLEQEVCSSKRPLHLLFLNEPSAHYLIDRRFNEGGANPFSLSPSFAEVWNELTVVLDVSLELSQPVCYLRSWG